MLSNVSDQNPVEQVTEVVQVAPTDQELSLVAVENEHAVTTSLRVAEVFGKQHYNVMKAIKSLDCSEEFRAVNFNASKIDYQNGNIKKQLPMYYITRDGFMFLVMGFTGKTAAKWKEAYIKAFNEMEAKIRAEQMAKAIEEHDRKEAIEYEKLLEREEREEAAIDARVAAMPPAKSRKGQAEPQTTEQQTNGSIIEDYNGKRVVSSLTLAKLQGREHYYVCDSVRRIAKYFARPGRVIYRCSRAVNNGNGGERQDGVVYYVTIEAFRTMCRHCHSITKEVQEQVLSAYNKAKGHHGKPVANAHVPEYKKRLAAKQAKTPTTPPTPTATVKPQTKPTAQTPTAANMPQTPTDLMQRFVKAMGVMMGMDTNEMFNLTDKGE